MSRILPSASIHLDPRTLASGRPYAERSERDPGLPDRAAQWLFATTVKPLWHGLRDPARRLASIIEHVERHEELLRSAEDARLAAIARGMRARLHRSGLALPLVGECFALIREAASRTIGKRHYESQLQAGWALLQGRLTEMETGEGKTFAATLPAGVIAFSGFPVHIITVNDYLAQRDAEEMGPLYGFLGLSVGKVIQGMSRAERQQAYRESITYCSNKELAFDYLRDSVAAGRRNNRLHLALEKLRGADRGDKLVLRGLHFGIVDEADSVFVDEARTPLILSSTMGSAEEGPICEQMLELARSLIPDEDYATDLVERSISLTNAGNAKLAEFASGRAGVWTSLRAREEMVTQAITALVLFRRDEHYVVSDGKVYIVDESTGRIMPDRSWERGLHQFIEVKESCQPTDRRESIARLTYQRLFRRYVRLAGMTGTAKEVAREINSIYGLDVVRIPLHRPSQRQYGRNRVYATKAEKWQEVARVVEKVALSAGRPVLIGTRSVAASEEISSVLHKRGIEHSLLNAKQDKQEAEIVALAGLAGRVTVATNMAGRGTDIRLEPHIAAKGGLHVILTEFHDARRIDRQLFGRCARQGDRGSCEAIVSLEDDLFAIYAPRLTRFIAHLRHSGFAVPKSVYRLLRSFAQFSAERRSSQVRMQNLNLDKRLDQVLAFSGRGE